ncbi:MAG: 30S ribosomal protein S9 [Patescibacteria group bacterium]|nr:30S ribosomal protein S9 [Patescibacteria group bacterium]
MPKIADEKTELKKDSKNQFYYAVGRRKEAIAQIKLVPAGDGKVIINGRELKDYFRGQAYLDLLTEPLRVTNCLNRFSVSVKVKGSGLSGQTGAVVNGLAKALEKVDPQHRVILRKKGFLTRDPRVRERRKVGQMGKARKKKQSPKR